jgi:hypothetical protein
MPVPLATLVLAAESATKLLKEVPGLVESIRSGPFGRNANAKQALAETTAKLRENLQTVGLLAQLAGTYFRAHENALELHWLCNRAERFLQDNLNATRERDTEAYKLTWTTVEEMFDTIGRNSDTSRQVAMNIADWYEEDGKQITLLFNQFTAAYNQADAYKQARAPVDMLNALRAMTASLQNVETLLENTMQARILATLQNIGR